MKVYRNRNWRPYNPRLGLQRALQEEAFTSHLQNLCSVVFIRKSNIYCFLSADEVILRAGVVCMNRSCLTFIISNQSNVQCTTHKSSMVMLQIVLCKKANFSAVIFRLLGYESHIRLQIYFRSTQLVITMMDLTCVTIMLQMLLL